MTATDDDGASATTTFTVNETTSALPTVSINDPPVVTEGDDGQRNLLLTLRRDSSVGAPSVSFSTADDTAIAGKDYLATSAIQSIVQLHTF